MAYKFFDKKNSGGGIKTKNISKQELAEELHKVIIKKNWKTKSTLIVYRQYLGCGSC